MSNWRITSKSSSYIEALKATESIEEPSVGFVKPTESIKGTTTIIKQNNTIIQLLVKISEGVEDCKESIQNIRKVVAEQASAGTKSDITSTIEELQKNLNKLSLGEPVPRPKKKEVPFFVFKDPLKIFEEEKKKSSSKNE
jgi:hypothetical protein